MRGAAALVPVLAACGSGIPIDELNAAKLSLVLPAKVRYPGEAFEVVVQLQSVVQVGTRVWMPESFEGGLEAADNPGAADANLRSAPAEAQFPKKDVLMPDQLLKYTFDISAELDALSGEDRVIWIRWRLGKKTSPWYQLALMRTREAVVRTSHGSFTLEFLPELAPRHAVGFIQRARKGFYDGKAVHHVRRGDRIVFGDPQDREGPAVPAEADPMRGEDFGDVGAWYELRPDTARSAFFVRLAKRTEAFPAYSIFARVTEGAETLRAIEALAEDGPPKEPVTIEKIELREKKIAGGGR